MAYAERMRLAANLADNWSQSSPSGDERDEDDEDEDEDEEEDVPLDAKLENLPRFFYLGAASRDEPPPVPDRSREDREEDFLWDLLKSTHNLTVVLTSGMLFQWSGS